MPALSFDLKDKSVLVTGASRGIGKAIALALGSEGACVGVTFTGSSETSKSNAAAVCADIKARGGRALPISLDVSNEDQVAAAVDGMVKEFGGLYGLVNNAGVAIDQLMMRYKADDWDKLMNTNLKGAFLVAKACLRPMLRAGGASIVNMSSVVGEMGNAGQVPYSASKAGLIGLTKSMAREYGSKMIRVNAVAPGFIETDMTHAMTDDAKAKMFASIPLNKLGSPDDIAFGTLYLLSPCSKYVTGHVLDINGGLYM
jgi:3-oxoacyl-[acyl-carrier protein] reductase